MSYLPEYCVLGLLRTFSFEIFAGILPLLLQLLLLLLLSLLLLSSLAVLKTILNSL